MTLNYPINNTNSDLSVNYLNYIFRNLNLKITNTNVNDITETSEYVLSNPLSQNMLNKLNSQLVPPLTKITIYYPISFTDEFDPIPIPYNIPSGFTPVLILGAIFTFYNQELGENNIIEYIKKNQIYSEFLIKIRSGGKVYIKDIMFDRIFIEYLDIIFRPKNSNDPEGYLLGINQQ